MIQVLSQFNIPAAPVNNYDAARKVDIPVFSNLLLDPDNPLWQTGKATSDTIINNASATNALFSFGNSYINKGLVFGSNETAIP